MSDKPQHTATGPMTAGTASPPRAEDVPDLLAQVERLTEQRDALAALVKRHFDDNGDVRGWPVGGWPSWLEDARAALKGEDDDQERRRTVSTLHSRPRPHPRF